MPDDLVQGLWDEIAPEAEQWRQMGVFGAAVEVPESAPLQDRLPAGDDSVGWYGSRRGHPAEAAGGRVP